MSSAARITSPTPRCRSRFSRRFPAPRRCSAITICSTDASGEGLSKRTGALSIASLRENGIESLAAAALAVLVGSAEAVHPVASLDELAASFDLSRLSHGAARFDEAELRALSARTLHQLPYAAVADRLAMLAIYQPRAEPFWEAMRGNLTRLDDAVEWWAVAHGEIDPVVEDREFLARCGGLPAAGALERGDLGRLDPEAETGNRPERASIVPPPADGADRARVGARTCGASATHRTRYSVGPTIRTRRLTPSGPVTSTLWP